MTQTTQRSRSGRRTVLVGALAALLLGIVPNARAFVQGDWCANPVEIKGIGAPSQIRLHYEMFVPAYEKKCKKAAGLVSYFTADDLATVTRATLRGPNPVEQDYDQFWAMDRVLTPTEKEQIETDSANKKNQVSQIGQFPLFVKGIGVAYNVQCQKKPVNFSGTNLSLIYLGQITTWNDQRLVQDNPGLATCNRPIKLTGRADRSGQTTTFKSYLALWNPAWEAYAQPQLNTAWPTPLVCRAGSDRGALGCVASQPGAIGYVDLEAAKARALSVGAVERLTGTGANPTAREFVQPSLGGCSQAAASIAFPPGFDVYTDWNLAPMTAATKGYPLCFFSFLLAFKEPALAYGRNLAPEPFQTLRDYLSTVFSAPLQKQMASWGLGTLPANILKLDKDGLDRIEYPTCPVPVTPPWYTHNDCWTLNHPT